MTIVTTVPNTQVNVWDPKEDILDEIIVPFKGDIVALQDKLDGYLASIVTAIGEYTPTFDDVSDEVPDLNLPGLPDAPNTDLELNEDWPSNDITDPDIKDSDPDFSYTKPVAPAVVSPTFDYTPGEYTSCTWDQLCALIKTSLDEGGTGLTDIVYGLIIDRNQEARRNVEESARRRMSDAVGARGFDLAGGMVSAALLELEKDILAKDFDAVNSTTIKDFEVADANTKFTKELALKMDEVQRQAYASDEARYLQAAQVTTEMLLAIYKAEWDAYLAEWEGVKIQLEAVKIEIEAISSWNESQVKLFTARMEAYKTEVEAIVAENQGRISIVLAEVQIYEASVRAVIAEFSAQVEEMKAKLLEYQTKVGLSIDKEKVNLEAFTSSATLAEQALEAATKATSQALASAYGAINTQLSSGFSGSARVSSGQTLTNTLSETHRYEEA